MAKLEIARHFEGLTDPRMVTENLRHDLIDIVVLAVCAMLSGAEGWKDIFNYSVARQHIFSRHLRLRNGIPSDDTFRRVIGAIKSSELTACFQSWVGSIAQLADKPLINIDGKTARRSHDKKKGIKALHMVTAWAADSQVVLGQEAVDEKSNEITAIPVLLAMLELEGAVVTIDAMGCQREIAQQIVDAKGDYILGLKGNQGKLHDAVQELAEEALSSMEHVRKSRSLEVAHGRHEERDYCQIQPSPEFLKEHNWPGLKTIGVAIRTSMRDGKESIEVRYYLLSLLMGVKRFATGCRGHWGIENSLHWTLDMTFNEDQSRIRGEGAINSAAIRRMALSLLKNYKGDKESVRQRKLKCAWDESYLFKILGISA